MGNSYTHFAPALFGTFGGTVYQAAQQPRVVEHSHPPYMAGREIGSSEVTSIDISLNHFVAPAVNFLQQAFFLSIEFTRNH